MVTRVLTLIALVSLAGCAGGRGLVSSLPATTQTAPSNGGRATASFVFKVPAAGSTATAAGKRAPRYISPSTQSLGINVDYGTANASFTGQNIGPGQPGCNNPTPLSPLICTLQISVNPGPHTFDFRTYDGLLDGNGNPQGNLLSANLGFPFTIHGGQANTINFTLQGIPAAIAVLPQPNQDLRGDTTGGFDLYGAYKADGSTIYPRTMTVVTTDADGNFIVGNGAPAVTVQSSNTGALSNGVAAANNPNVFTVTPGTYSANAPMQLTFTATPSTASQSNSGASPTVLNVPVRYVARNAPRLYISGGPTRNWIQVFDTQGNPVTVSGTFPNLSNPESIGYDPVGKRILVPNEGNGTVTAYDTDGNQVAFATPITGVNTPIAVAYDTGRNRIYVATHDAGVFVFDPNGNPISVAGNWKVPAPRGNGTTLPYDPTALLIDTKGGTSFGNVYLNDVTNGGSIAVYDGEGNGITSFSSDNGTASLAQDPVSGRLYGSWTAHAITVFDEAGNIIAVPGTWPHTAQPNAIVFNPANGYLYAYDDDASAFGYANSVTAYDASGNEITLPNTFSTAAHGWGMTLVP